MYIVVVTPVLDFKVTLIAIPPTLVRSVCYNKALLWSDPSEKDGIHTNIRGAGVQVRY